MFYLQQVCKKNCHLLLFLCYVGEIKMGKGRPKGTTKEITKSVQVAFRVTEDVKNKINERAKAKGYTFSQYMIYLIENDISHV